MAWQGHLSTQSTSSMRVRVGIVPCQISIAPTTWDGRAPPLYKRLLSAGTIHIRRPWCHGGCEPKLIAGSCLKAPHYFGQPF